MKKRIFSVVLTLAIAITLIPVMPTIPVKAAATINIGDYVQMGKYYDEPILWRCVDIDENGPLMLADRILTIKPFDARGTHKYLDETTQADSSNYRTYFGSNLWETSNMRSWLNSTATAGNVTWLDGCPPSADKVANGYNAYASEKGFLAEGNFTVSEKNVIKSITQKSLLNSVDVTKLKVGGTVIHSYNNSISTVIQNFDTAYYHNVTDKMFVLDVKQINKVYQNSTTLGTDYWRGKPTQKAVDKSTYKNSSLATGSYWSNWLRSPYTDSNGPTSVRWIASDGHVVYTDAYNDMLGVRPAFYLNLSAVSFASGNGLAGTPFVAIALLLGDVNASATVTAADALLVLQASAGKITLTPYQAFAADVNASGTVTASDALRILQFAAGKITGF